MLHLRTTTWAELNQHAADGSLYAILDACDQPAVPAKVRELGDTRASSLYRGTAEEEYSGFAPYVVQVDLELLQWVLSVLLTEHWGIFAVAQLVDLEIMRKHFRSFLLVESPDGGRLYFRYYDPRVLKRFLPTCTDLQLRQFLGPISTFVFNDPEKLQTAIFVEYRSSPNK